MVFFCDSGATRTLDPQLRRLLLYPTELRNLLQAAKIHFFSVFTTVFLTDRTFSPKSLKR